MKAYGWFGLFLLIVSEYGLFRKIDPFYSWFYCFAWWSYILLADNLLLRLRGRSLLTGPRRELALMLPLSVSIWLIFEGYNLVVRNWAYSRVPSPTWERWTGYTLAFATVLPGLFVTSDLIASFFPRRDQQAASDCEELGKISTSKPSPILLALGVVLTAAPLIWPRYCFPAVWIGPIFLLDPLLEKLGYRSLSMELASGKRRRVWSLLMGGLACGILWEFWNFWADAKWIYSIPFFGNWKLFEMPLLGFLGFPPFALECYILYHVLRACALRCSSAMSRATLCITIAVFCFFMYEGIDHRTVIGFAAFLCRSIDSWVRA